MMGYELRRALREALGAEITGLQRLVALEIADDANDETRMSYAPLHQLAKWTGAKDVKVVRTILKRLAEAGWEFRVPLGEGQDGRILFAVPGKRLTFRVPDFEGVTAVTPSVVEGGTTVTPIDREGVTTVAEGVTTVPTEATGVTPFSSISSSSPTTGAAPVDEAAGALFPGPAGAAMPRGAEEPKPAKHAVADELAKAFFEHDREKLTQGFLAIRGIVRTAIANGNDRDQLAHALHRLAEEGRAISGGTLAVALRQVRGTAPAAITGPSEATRGPEARPVAETLSQRPAEDSIVPAAASEYFQQMRAQLRNRPLPAVQPTIDDLGQVGDDPDELVEF